MYVVEFAPPAKAWSLNQERNKHPMWRAKLVTAWRECAKFSALEQLPMADFKNPPDDGLRWLVDVDLPVKGNRRRDPINWVPAVKAINDGLTEAGCFEDDTPNFVRQCVPDLVVNSDRVKVYISRTEMPRTHD